MRNCDSGFCLTGMLKAIPAEEGGERIIYLEASNEAKDYEGERVLSAALQDSAEYFLRYGNIDLDHITIRGPKLGIRDYSLYEIGRPVDVQVRSPQTFVKAVIYQGPGESAKSANEFWSSITEQHPPQQWFPSVGGAYIDVQQEIDPESGERMPVVSKVRWMNIGMSKTPVNLAVPGASTVPFGVFAKAWSNGALDVGMLKALTASAATDVATLTGGGALGQQSLQRKVHSFWDWRELVSLAMQKKRLKPSVRALLANAKRLGVPDDEAAQWVERLINDLKNNLKR